MNDNILEVKNVSKAFGTFKLENVSFNLPKGCIMGLIGENGAGKSTIIKLILDLIKKDTGDINIMGYDNLQIPTQERSKIGVVFDSVNFPENLDTASINKVMKNIYGNWNEEKFFSYVKQFELPERKKKFNKFSKGMKMKLAIAVALSHNPQLLIMDEPTAGLDPIVRDEVLDILLDFIQNENNSVLISSHITSDLEKVADYITFIHHGKILLSEEKYLMTEQYVLLKCGNGEENILPAECVVGKKSNSFGCEVLADTSRLRHIPQQFVVSKPSIEEIMLFFTRNRKG